MNLDKGDKVYIPGKDEEPPIMACLIHPGQPALQVYQVKEKVGFEVVRYGLCPWCDRKLKTDKTYMVFIDKKICQRLEQMRPEEKHE